MSVASLGARRVAPARSVARRAGLPVRAFVASRALVLASGVVGALTLAKHSAVAAAAARSSLGPVGSVLTGAVDRFDAGYYLDIAAHGYGTPAMGRAAFFPLYPLLIRGVTPITGSPVLAGFLISAGALLCALIVLHRLTALELGRAAADATVLLIAFAPLSFFFTAIYTESLFLALSAGSVYAARTGRWRMACGLGALTALTRPPGVLIVLALVALRVRERGGADRALAWTLAVPAGLAGYAAWLSTRGFGWLGFLHAQAGWSRAFTGPVVGVAAGAWAGVRGLARIASGAVIYRPALTGPFTPPAEDLILLVVLVAAAAGVVACLRRLPLGYGLYAAAVLILCVSSPAAGEPLWSLDRFVLTLFPVWMVAGDWVARRGWLRPALALSSALLVFYTLQFSAWAFIA